MVFYEEDPEGVWSTSDDANTLQSIYDKILMKHDTINGLFSD